MLYIKLAFNLTVIAVTLYFTYEILQHEIESVERD